MKQRTWNPADLAAPLRWRKPYLVTLDVDLFDGRTDEEIAAVFGVMAACPKSIFRVWTAHPKRAREWFEWLSANEYAILWNRAFDAVGEDLRSRYPLAGTWVWPLRNVWLGIIAHTQAELDERAPEILACLAALHWLWLVLHERVDARWFLRSRFGDGSSASCMNGPAERHIEVSGAIGKGAPPCDVEWIRDAIRQGRAAGVPVYVRALGARPRHMPTDWGAACRPDGICALNGDRPGEWPDDLQVREWPDGAEVDG